LELPTVLGGADKAHCGLNNSHGAKPTRVGVFPGVSRRSQVSQTGPLTMGERIKRTEWKSAYTSQYRDPHFPFSPTTSSGMPTCRAESSTSPPPSEWPGILLHQRWSDAVKALSFCHHFSRHWAKHYAPGWPKPSNSREHHIDGPCHTALVLRYV